MRKTGSLAWWSQGMPKSFANHWFRGENTLSLKKQEPSTVVFLRHYFSSIASTVILIFVTLTDVPSISQRKLAGCRGENG